MIRVIEEGDIFKSAAQTWVNTVNTVGVMGKGIALGFKRRFPDMFADYVERCRSRQVALGRPYLFKRPEPPWVLNFPTKDHWRSVTKLSDIIEGLAYLERRYSEWGIESLAVPPLGCGEGQLEWRVVGPTLYRHLAKLDIPIELYAPFGTPHEELQSDYLAKQLSFDDAVDSVGNGPTTKVPASWVALVEILKRLESERYHYPVGRVSFQKIAYFATLAGIPTEIEFQRSSFGPFAPEVKVVTTRLVNNGLVEEEKLGRMFRVRPGSTFESARRVFADDLAGWGNQVDRVADLFARMNTERAEVAATIAFAAHELADELSRRPSEKEVLDYVTRWKQNRRPPLDETALGTSIRDLAMLGWLDVDPSSDLSVENEIPA